MKVPLLLLALLPASVFADHGKHFLLTESWEMPRNGQVFLVGNLSWYRDSGIESLSAEPGFLFGVGSGGRYAFELHAHIDQTTGDSSNYDATGFELRGKLKKIGDWHTSLGLEYEIGDDAGEGGTSVRLVAGRENANGIVVFNLIGESGLTSTNDVEWSYRAAWGQGSVPKGPSFAVELAGELIKDGIHEILPSVNWRTKNGTLLKAGIGIGLTSSSPAVTFRAGIVAPLG